MHTDLYKYLLISSMTLLLACGGGGGGGGGIRDNIPSSQTSNNEPDSNKDDDDIDDDLAKIPDPIPPGTPSPADPFLIDNEDPPIIGASVERRGDNTFTIEVNGSPVTISAVEKIGSRLVFDTKSVRGDTRSVAGFENANVLALSFVQFKSHGFDSNTHILGITGNWTENMPVSGTKTYEGEYTRISKDGETIVTTAMDVVFNFDNVLRGGGNSREGGEEVEVDFHGLIGNAVSGTILDDNNFGNDAAFGFFGPGANTLAGGYASGFGAGLLTVEAK